MENNKIVTVEDFHDILEVIKEAYGYVSLDINFPAVYCTIHDTQRGITHELESSTLEGFYNDLTGF